MESQPSESFCLQIDFINLMFSNKTVRKYPLLPSKLKLTVSYCLLGFSYTKLMTAILSATLPRSFEDNEYVETVPWLYLKPLWTVSGFWNQNSLHKAVSHQSLLNEICLLGFLIRLTVIMHVNCDSFFKKEQCSFLTARLWRFKKSFRGGSLCKLNISLDVCAFETCILICSHLLCQIRHE